ncbi:MAG: metalloregulator ArsR/SmtB family transcription factor [Candidatus Bathyarchaeota archaeon]|nr:metalloregulator ArsR/SmtB family transcription factor [Candidatus Bathyarchaeota archaeon]
MSRTQVDKRLARLVRSSICPAGDASEYADELRELADKIANKALAKKESRFFKSLADENRIGILKLLMLREMCVCEIMVALNLTQPTASHHLGILEKEGVIKRKKEGKWVYYTIADSEILEGMKKLGLLK